MDNFYPLHYSEGDKKIVCFIPRRGIWDIISMKHIPKFFIICFTAALAGIIITILLWQENTLPTATLAISPPFLDWGEVSAKNGKQTRTVTLANEGAQEIKIFAISTSCGCTEAKIVEPSILSPQGQELYRLPPDTRATLAITFDPNAHQDARGAIERVVYIQSSDPFGEREIINRITVVD